MGRATENQVCGRCRVQVWERSPLARERSLFGFWDDTDDSQEVRAAMAAGAASAALDSGDHASSQATPHSNGGARPCAYEAANYKPASLA